MVDVELSASEAALYDRQLRLWGVEAQQKLRSTNVLLAGLGPMGSEVAKNIVLSGINSLFLLDDRVLQRDVDIPGQFMAPFDAIGQNRAEASVSRLATLNPNVKIEHSDKKIEDLEANFFDNFHIVCLIDYPFDALRKVNSICRSKKIAFLAADTYGSFGYMFSDLGESFYCTSETKFVDKSGDEIKKVNEHTVQFLDFESSFKLKDPKSLSKGAKTNEVFLLSLLKEKLRENDSSDVNAVAQCFAEIGEKIGLNLEDLPIECLHDGELIGQQRGGTAGVCAVVGGVVGQEIIKIASRNDLPFNNYFSFNGVNSNARVITL